MSDEATTIESPIETPDEAKRERRTFPYRVFREVSPGLYQLTTMPSTDKLSETERLILTTGIEGAAYLAGRLVPTVYRVPSRKLEAVPL